VIPWRGVRGRAGTNDLAAQGRRFAAAGHDGKDARAPIGRPGCAVDKGVKSMLSAHRACIAFGIGAAAAAITPVRADPVLDYTLGIEVEHDSNTNLSRVDPISQSIVTPGITFGLKEEGSTLNLTAAGAVDYRDYLQGDFADEFRTLLSGVGVWTISPQRFDWVFEDYLGRQPLNVLVPDAPANQQQTNVFTTGPTFRAHFSDALRGKLDLRYTNTYAEQTDGFNGDRLNGTAQLAYLLDAQNTLAGALAATGVRYDKDVSAPYEYDRYDLYGGYDHTTRQIKVNLAAGYSWLNFRQGSDDSGPLLRAGVTWTPTTLTTLGVHATREFADATTNLMIDPTQIGNLGVGSGNNGTVVSPQVYVLKELAGTFQRKQDNVYFEVAPFWRNYDYLGGGALNQRSFGYLVSVSWLMRPRYTLAGGTGREHRNYTDLDRVDDDMTYWLAFIFQQSRHWAWQLRATHLSRDSTVYDSGYSDRVYTLSLTYSR
jgi:hypothetical protein